MLARSNLRHYQNEGVERIKSNSKTALWTIMGGGKTATTLTAAVDLIDDLEIMRGLIIAPLRVANRNWHLEALKWEHTSHLKFHRLSPPSQVKQKKGESAESFKARKESRKPHQKEWVRQVLLSHYDFYIANVEQVEYLTMLFGDRWPFDFVVIDESSLFKSHSSKRWKALRRVSKHIKRMVQLTGSPASNGIQNLWSQIFLMDGGDRLLRTFTGFKAKWFDENRYTFKITPKEGAREEIMDRIADLVHVVSEYEGLPPIVENTILLDMTEDVKQKYQKMERDFLLSLPEGDIEAPTAATLWNKLLQVSNGAIYDEKRNVHHIHDIKINALKEILDGTDESVIIVYNYKHDADRIKKAIKGVVELDNQGSVIPKWERGEIRTLLMHPRSGGHGLDGFQFGGRTLVWFGATSDLDLYHQMNARLRRSGQQKTVFINRLILEDTLESSVLNSLKNKDDFQSTLLDKLKEKREDL